MNHKNEPITIEPMPNMVTDYTLGVWLIGGPFHLCWNQWLCSLVHLRGDNEGEPPVIVLEGATHELVIMSIDSKKKATPEGVLAVDFEVLHPIDVAQQFIEANDAEALGKVENVLEQIKMGQLSPDSDFRSSWEHHLTDCPAMAIPPGIKT